MTGSSEGCQKASKIQSFRLFSYRLGKCAGWINPWQSYFNNSTDWWVAKCKASFEKVTVLDSAWQDERSVGKWLICE